MSEKMRNAGTSGEYIFEFFLSLDDISNGFSANVNRTVTDGNGYIGIQRKNSEAKCWRVVEVQASYLNVFSFDNLL